MDLNNIKVKRIFDDPGYITYVVVELETGEMVVFSGELNGLTNRPKRWEWSKSIFDVTSENAHFVTDFLPTEKDYYRFPYKKYVDIYDKEYGYYKIKPDILLKIVKAVKEHCDRPNDSTATVRFIDCPELYENDVYNEDDYGIDDDCIVNPDNLYPEETMNSARLNYENDEYYEEDCGEENENSGKSEEISDREKIDADELSETKNVQSTNCEEGYNCKGQDKTSLIF